jgi:hypothetical protein
VRRACWACTGALLAAACADRRPATQSAHNRSQYKEGANGDTLQTPHLSNSGHVKAAVFVEHHVVSESVLLIIFVPEQDADKAVHTLSMRDTTVASLALTLLAETVGARWA